MTNERACARTFSLASGGGDYDMPLSFKKIFSRKLLFNSTRVMGGAASQHHEPLDRVTVNHAASSFRRSASCRQSKSAKVYTCPPPLRHDHHLEGQKFVVLRTAADFPMPAYIVARPCAYREKKIIYQ